MNPLAPYARQSVDPDLLRATITLILAHGDHSPLETTDLKTLIAMCSETFACPPDIAIPPLLRALAFLNVVQPGRPGHEAQMASSRVDWHAVVAAASATVTIDAAFSDFDFDDASYAAALAAARTSPPDPAGLPFTLDELANGKAPPLPAVPAALLSGGIRLARLLPTDPAPLGRPFQSLIERINEQFEIRPVMSLSIAGRIHALSTARQDPRVRALPRDPAGASATGAMVIAAAQIPITITPATSDGDTALVFQFDIATLLSAIDLTSRTPSASN